MNHDTGLQIAVSHPTMFDQNSFLSDQILCLAGHNFQAKEVAVLSGKGEIPKLKSIA